MEGLSEIRSISTKPTYLEVITGIVIWKVKEWTTHQAHTYEMGNECFEGCDALEPRTFPITRKG